MTTCGELAKSLADDLCATLADVTARASALRNAGLLPDESEALTSAQAFYLLLAAALEGPTEATVETVSLLASLKFKGTHLSPLIPWQGQFVPADHPGSRLSPSLRLIDIFYGLAVLSDCEESTTAQLVTMGSDGRAGFAAIDLRYRDDNGTPDTARLLFGRHPLDPPVNGPARPVRSVQFSGHVLATLTNLVTRPELGGEDGMKRAAMRGAAFWHPAPAMVS